MTPVIDMRRIVFSVTIFLLTSCATAYQPLGSTGGYSDVQFGKKTFKVVFTGNGNTSQQRAEDLALLRASELTLIHGFRYFVVDSAESRNRHGFIADTSPVWASFTTSTGSRVIMIISCLKYKPVESNRKIFDARFLAASIRKNYDLGGENNIGDTVQNTSKPSVHSSKNLPLSETNSDETIPYRFYQFGPNSLREFMSGGRNLSTAHGKNFFTDFLSSLWYINFKKTHQRNPVIAIIDQGKAEAVHPRQVWIPVHGGLFYSAGGQPSWADKDYLQEILLKSGKIGVVIYKHRELSSGERLFQMKHAASRYIKEPGHLEGADAVLILKKKKFRMQPLTFKPENLDFPVVIAKVTPVWLDIKLIDIATDELLWTHLYPLTLEINDTYCKPPEPGLTETPNFSNSCFSPKRRVVQDDNAPSPEMNNGPGPVANPYGR